MATAAPNVDAPWLDVVGIGDDGLDGLPAAVRERVDGAEVLVGGERHLAMVPPDARERMPWPSPFRAVGEALARYRGRKVCVLASGNPSCHGVGTILARTFGPHELRIWPAASAFSLACARLGWPLQALDTLSLHGRPLGRLVPFMQPGARILVLSNDRHTPAAAAALLTEHGFGPSRVVALSHMGGPSESRDEARADGWARNTSVADLNTLAIECRPEPGSRVLSRAPGLPDDAFEHDGQITKREVRAVTLALLAPTPSQVLWDVGAGCGSIAIEWLRHDQRCQAVAIEANSNRAAFAARNAEFLGVPQLAVINDSAPRALADLEAPDAVFIGGGLTEAGLGEACWQALRPGGRLVANAVTLEGEQMLAHWQQSWGGDLRRIEISRGHSLGRFRGWRPMAPVTQYAVVRGAGEGAHGV